MAAHTLKGSALAVGAWAVAHVAEEAERAGPREPARSHQIARLEAAIAEASGYIESLPAG